MKTILLLLVGLLVFILPLTVFSCENDVKLNSRDRIEDYIILGAMKHGLSVTKALYIAKCESGLLPNAKSKSSSASGIYQFINGTWFETMNSMGLSTISSRFDPRINIDAGLFLMKTSGDHHWNESKPCWGPKVLDMLSDLP